MATERHQCATSVWGQYNSHPCPNAGKVQRGGKWYCGVHDPEAVRARREEADREWQSKFESQLAAEKRRAERERLADAAPGLLAASKAVTQELRRMHGEGIPNEFCGTCEALVAARAAIAAAEGGTEEGHGG